MTIPRVVLVFLWFCLYHCRAQISKEECYSCVAEGCEYCTGSNDATTDGGFVASSLYCECDADVSAESMLCFATESHCDLAMNGIFSLAIGAVLLPCLCSCIVLGTCIYCCCQRNRKTGDYYVEADELYASSPHRAAAGTTRGAATTRVHVPHQNTSATPPFSLALG